MPWPLPKKPPGCTGNWPATNPTFLPDLASALTNLGNRFREAGAPDRGEAPWEQAITEAAPQAAAYLLAARAGAADAGHPAAAVWLARALAMDIKDRDLIDAAHEHARRHRGPDPAAFDQNWARHTGGQVPAWLTVNPALLSSARAWVATDTYTAERDHLAAHPELFEAAADTAVAEAVLAVPEDEASRYSALRQAAQQDGVEAAYRPLLLIILAHEFADADPGRQRALLADRRDELLTDTVADALNELARQEDQQGAAARRATALLDLARTGDAELVFEALTEPDQFPAPAARTGHPIRRRQSGACRSGGLHHRHNHRRGGDRPFLPRRRHWQREAARSRPAT